MSAVVEIELTHYSASGGRYRVLHDGEEIISSCKNPEFDAARELVRRGVTGRLQWKRRGHDQIDGSGLIAILATKTVSEGAKASPHIVEWAPYHGADS